VLRSSTTVTREYSQSDRYFIVQLCDELPQRHAGVRDRNWSRSVVERTGLMNRPRGMCHRRHSRPTRELLDDQDEMVAVELVDGRKTDSEHTGHRTTTNDCRHPRVCVYVGWCVHRAARWLCQVLCASATLFIISTYVRWHLSTSVSNFTRPETDLQRAGRLTPTSLPSYTYSKPLCSISQARHQLDPQREASTFVAAGDGILAAAAGYRWKQSAQCRRSSVLDLVNN